MQNRDLLTLLERQVAARQRGQIDGRHPATVTKPAAPTACDTPTAFAASSADRDKRFDKPSSGERQRAAARAAAAITPSDIVLEPSAGTGLLAVSGVCVFGAVHVLGTRPLGVQVVQLCVVLPVLGFAAWCRGRRCSIPTAQPGRSRAASERTPRGHYGIRPVLQGRRRHQSRTGEGGQHSEAIGGHCHVDE